LNAYEVLAPVGNEENFYAAINNGADAVYLGLKNFNARDKAQNFNSDNIASFVNYAHLNNVKVYVTINTILTDSEINAMLNMVADCVKAKVDAYIVQDFGVATILKKAFKNIVLHASTQMGIHNLLGAKVAENMGFKRIVLSRETSEEDIKQIKNNTNLELEYFVQGALCVCFSGNCYYSSLMHNESGNRGRCLQLCRLPHTAVIGNESETKQEVANKGFLLSTADLCLYKKIKHLYDLGICSFKIEGRLRRASYVAYTTLKYAQAKKFLNLDNEETLYNFSKLFNRGAYNEGIYLNQLNNKNIINPNFQNHRGILIGSVVSAKPFKDIYEVLVLTNGYEINKNDGLKFVYNSNEVSLGVGSFKKTNHKNEYVIYTKAKAKPGAEVYLTVDFNWEEELVKNKKFLPFNACFIAKVGKKPQLKLSSGGVEVSSVLFENCEKSINQALNKEDVKQSLLKTQDTCFKLKNLTCEIDNVFLPKSKLNELRRNAITKLQEALIHNYEKLNCIAVEEISKNYCELLNINIKKDCTNCQLNNDVTKNCSLKNNTINVCNLNKNTTSIDSLNKDTATSCEINANIANNCEVDKNNFVVVDESFNLTKDFFEKYKGYNVVLSPIHFCLENVDNFIKKVLTFGIKKVYLNLPKVARYEDLIVINNVIFNFSPEQIGLIANNIYGLYYLQKNYEVVGGVYLNIANTCTKYFLKDIGVNAFVKSFENFANEFCCGLTFVGKPALMMFCHCPYKTSYNYSSCKDCKFNNNLFYKNQAGREMKILRTKIQNCYFEMLSDQTINSEYLLNKDKQNNVFLDLRNL